jgi:hypothetical protein
MRCFVSAALLALLSFLPERVTADPNGVIVRIGNPNSGLQVGDGAEIKKFAAPSQNSPIFGRIPCLQIS